MSAVPSVPRRRTRCRTEEVPRVAEASARNPAPAGGGRPRSNPWTTRTQTGARRYAVPAEGSSRATPSVTELPVISRMRYRPRVACPGTATHNPEVAGSNPALATTKAQVSATRGHPDGWPFSLSATRPQPRDPLRASAVDQVREQAGHRGVHYGRDVLVGVAGDRRASMAQALTEPP